MSHYLNNIIAKTTGTANILQPRPRSLYEPVAAASAPDLVEMQQLRTAVSPPIEQPDRPATAVTPQVPTPSKEQTNPSTSNLVAKTLPKSADTRPPLRIEKNSEMGAFTSSPETPEITKPSKAEMVTPADAATKRPLKDPTPVEDNMKRSPPNLREIPQIKDQQSVVPTLPDEQTESKSAPIQLRTQSVVIQETAVPEMHPSQVPTLPDEQTEPKSALIQLQTQTVVVQETAVPPVAAMVVKETKTKWANEPSNQVAPNQAINSPVPTLPTPQNKIAQQLDTQTTSPQLSRHDYKSLPNSNLQTNNIVLTQMVPRIQAEESWSSSSETASTEPEIHVHIGRIEVRAAPPSPPTSTKPQRKSPVMNLDEYLQQRNHHGGKV